MDSLNVVVFKSISNFIGDLSTLYAKRQRSLLLYKRLIDKTTLVHEHAINKNIDIFKNFCTENRKAIQEMDEKELVLEKLFYSEKVFIDMKHIFNLADKASKSAIWRHLLTISAFVDPTKPFSSAMMSFDPVGKGLGANV